MRLLCCFAASLSFAQISTGPVVQPRGIVNADTQRPAPSQVAPGGFIEIRGLSLAAPVEVLVNNRAARVVSAASDKIVAQVPPETPQGLATVVVRKGEQSSRPARIQVANITPGLASENGRGFGAVATRTLEGKTVLRASGLGPVSEAGTPQADLHLLVDGMKRGISARPSADNPGAFDVVVDGEPLKPGAPVFLAVNNAVSNFLVQAPLAAKAELLFIPFPGGTPELRSLRSSDSRGSFLTASAARRPDGCYPSFVIDAEAKSMMAIPGCPTIAQVQQLSPAVDVVNGPAFGFLEGPFPGAPAGQAPTPFTDKLRIFRAAESTLELQLPERVQALNPAGTGVLAAVAGQTAGQPAKVFDIDSSSGEITERTAGPNPGVNPGAPAGAAGAANILARLQNLDLGDGLSQILTAPTASGNQILVTVGDSLTDPKKAKVAVLNVQLEVITQRDFPEGWLPLVAPAPPPAPGGNPGGNPGLPGGVNQFRVPTPMYFDAPTRSYYVTVHNGQGRHAFAYFAPEGDPRLLALPEEWTFTSCVPNIPVFNIELARRAALLASRTEDRSFKNPCPADGFALFDLAARTFRLIPLPGAGQLNASGGANELNDFLFGNNTDPARRNTADTLYVLDAANENSFRFDLPAGVNNFSGGQPVPAMNLIVAAANNRAAGDAGLILFDLETAESRLLPTPEGFALVNAIGVAPALRKVVARGILANNAGAQFLVYDLLTGDLEIVKNPDGVTWVGPAPAAPPTPGQPPQQQVQIPIRFNAKFNSVEAIALGEDRRQRGAVVLKLN